MSQLMCQMAQLQVRICLPLSSSFSRVMASFQPCFEAGIRELPLLMPEPAEKPSLHSALGYLLPLTNVSNPGWYPPHGSVRQAHIVVTFLRTMT